MSSKLIPRPHPCLCASCPECGAVFSAAAFNVRFSNAETWEDYGKYAEEGYTVSC